MNATSYKTIRKFSTGKVALLITLATESVFFITTLVAYAALRDQVTWMISRSISRLSIPLLNTSILLISTIIAWRSEKSILVEKKNHLQNGLLVASVLGILFIFGQIYEFNHAGMQINDPSFGGVFFTLIGFHAAHVLAGVFFLILNMIRARLGDFSANNHEAVILGNWFWYYVVAIWIILFMALYLI